MALQTSNPKGTDLKNPFPGLRPFRKEESHLFFGRENQIDKVSENLRKNRFVAVIGSSGSGKSSLIYCGVMSHATAKGDWKTIITRPGTNPFLNLYQSFLETFDIEDKLPASPDNGRYSDILMESLKNDHKKSSTRYLLVIDQFEELFRYRLAKKGDSSLVSRGDYTDFLVRLVNQEEVPVQIIMTMRSDFIGECSRFPNFTSLINRSNYLIPRMSRDNFRSVITEPVRIAGATIQPELVEKILDEMGDNQDQLPILQHALMRTWNYWKENSNPDKEISINDYEAVGGIARALSDHANEAFDELNTIEKTGCEKIFRTLTEKGMDNRGVRRPTTIGDLSRISSLDIDQVIRVIDVFRAEGRSFLTPAYHNLLDADSVIDLSHEALMRIWDRLSNWVDEEATAVNMYKRLSESAAQYQVGKSGLWRPPDLQLAINWKHKNNPNLAWAERHDPAFERTMVFLNTSEKEFEKEEANKLRLQRLRLRRSRLIALVLGTAAIISLVMFLWTRQLSVDLEQQIVIAENERANAQAQSKEAEAQRQLAQQRFEEAERQRMRADTAAQIAELRRLDAVESAQEAKMQTERAEANLIYANQQTELAQSNFELAERQRLEAEAARIEAFTRRMISIAGSMAVKSIQTIDRDLKALLAMQAYNFNKQYEGETKDPDIYNGLYYALRELKGQDYNHYQGHINEVRAVRFLPGIQAFLSGGSDGLILMWDLNRSNTEYSVLADGRNVISVLAVSGNGKFALAGENRTGLLYMDLQDTSQNPVILSGSDNNIRSIVISEDNRTVFTAGLKNMIEKWDMNSRTSKTLLHTGSRMNTLAKAPGTNQLAGALSGGQVVIWDTETDTTGNIIYNNPDDQPRSLCFTPDGNRLVCGMTNGDIRIYRTGSFELSTVLKGHVSRVTEIAISNSGNEMVSTSYDGKVLYWNMKDLTSPPIEFTDNQGFVFSVSFSSDGKYFITGSSEEARLVMRSTSADFLAEKICPLISRNMTEDEWNIYVGEDIDFEETCNNK